MALRVTHAVVSYLWYAAKRVWPGDLAILYPHPELPGGTPWALWQVIGSLVLLLAISGGVWRGRRRRWAIVG